MDLGCERDAISQRRNELAQMLLSSLGTLRNQQRKNLCTLQSDDVMSLEFGLGTKISAEKNDPPDRVFW